MKGVGELSLAQLLRVRVREARRPMFKAKNTGRI